MKYLEDSSLAKLTARLSDAAMTRSRAIRVQIDAYTMKRAGSDKKYAHALGEQYVAELETQENRMSHFMSNQVDLRTESTGEKKNQRKRSQSAGNQNEAITRPAKQQRSRAYSYDISVSSGNQEPAAALGSFCDVGARRLMTDLILTLNASFPDYDFGTVRAAEFEKIDLGEAVKKINERFSILGARDNSILSDLWSQIDSILQLGDCDVYSFVPRAVDDDEDPMSFLNNSLIQAQDDMESSNQSSVSCTVLSNFNFFFVSKHLKRILLFAGVETMKNEDCVHEDDKEEHTYVKFHSTDASNIDFDIDPSADIAGGIPISI